MKKIITTVFLIISPDAGEHVIANPLKSRSVDAVRNASYSFAEEIL